MYSVRYLKTYKKSLKKILRSGRFSIHPLIVVIDMLATGKVLPVKYQDHSLAGDLAWYRECHIRGDLLLVYEKDEENKIIILHNIGSHSELFG